MKTEIRKSIAAMALALGVPLLPQPAAAAVVTFSWAGMTTMLDPVGAALSDPYAPKGADPHHTPISGTLTYDTASGTGTAYSIPFYFFGNPMPTVLHSLSIQAIGDGAGNPGALWLMNGLLNFGGANSMPYSVVLDAGGLLAALPSSLYVGATIDGAGVRPAADGTYVGLGYPGTTDGYLDLGPVPIATTKWNVTPTCPPGGGNSGACINDPASGALPLIADTVGNAYDYNALFMGGDGSNDPGIGGSPFLAGPFENFSMNLNFTGLTVSAVVVPVPAAAWLLGAGLVGLIGVARRRRRE
jgi:hypothetical protein